MVDKVEVFNKSAGVVMYKIPNSPAGNVRTFSAHQKQTVSVQELNDLCQHPGGQELFYNYLYINDPEVVRSILQLEPEPEYWLTEDQIPTWMDTCSLDEFIDALNFAPKGTRDIIKKLSVERKLNDNNKRQAIKDILGYDVSAAIEAAEPDEDEVVAPAATTTRRASATSIETPTRQAKNTTIIVPKAED